MDVGGCVCEGVWRAWLCAWACGGRGCVCVGGLSVGVCDEDCGDGVPRMEDGNGAAEGKDCPNVRCSAEAAELGMSTQHA